MLDGVPFFVFRHKHSGCSLFLEDSGGPEKGLVGVTCAG